MTTNITIKHNSPDNGKFLRIITVDASGPVTNDIHPSQSVDVSIHDGSEIIINEYPVFVEEPVIVIEPEPEFQAPVDDVAPVGNPEADPLGDGVPVEPTNFPVIEDALPVVTDAVAEATVNDVVIDTTLVKGVVTVVPDTNILVTADAVAPAPTIEVLTATVSADQAEVDADLAKLAVDQAALDAAQA